MRTYKDASDRADQLVEGIEIIGRRNPGMIEALEFLDGIDEMRKDLKGCADRVVNRLKAAGWTAKQIKATRAMRAEFSEQQIMEWDARWEGIRTEAGIPIADKSQLAEAIMAMANEEGS